MQRVVNGIIWSIIIWIIIKVSEKVSGNTKHQIKNHFLYWFIWVWHSYGEISILGLICGKDSNVFSWSLCSFCSVLFIISDVKIYFLI